MMRVFLQLALLVLVPAAAVLYLRDLGRNGRRTMPVTLLVAGLALGWSLFTFFSLLRHLTTP
ncbi:MAG TPA: hypothetical protein DEF41_08895 [Desulfovibrio sp.]|nr:hypothetical protein [Desulfovibrio sp.]